MNYNTPGVFIEEIPTLPPSVAAVATAIPAFVGYTQIVVAEPVKITSFPEFEAIFGGPDTGNLSSVTINVDDTVIDDPVDPTLTPTLVSRIVSGPERTMPVHNLYYCVKHFYDNSGGECYVVSANVYTNPIDAQELQDAIALLEDVDEVTIICVPEAASLADPTNDGSFGDFNSVYQSAVAQATELKDRFVIIDVPQSAADTISASSDVSNFQAAIGVGDHPEYAAAYYPYLETTLDLVFAGVEANIILNHTRVTASGGQSQTNDPAFANLAEVQAAISPSEDLLARQIIQAVRGISVVLPPSAAVAGIYTRVDNARGVWKAPANASVAKTIKPGKKINDASQGSMNVDPNGGKSVNAIRAFTGRGILVWGARTLNGNDNEWRYVSVRRFFNFVEESTKKASYRFVFEPNDANTWNSMRAMIENFLTTQWKLGALQGAKPDDSFFVKVGLNQTMSPQDILEGRLIVEIGMAVVRPAEFIILRFMHQLPQS